jgi:Ni/Co efflux regulator RcnB
MTSKFSQFLLALVLCVTLAPGAYAKGGHGHGGGGDKQDKHKDKDKDKAHDRDDDRDHHADRDDHDRDGDSDKKHPAGWDKGKKTGWGDCDVPPGQVKKLGCHPNSKKHVAHNDKDSDHDRDRHTATNRSRGTTTGGAGKTPTTTGGAGKATTTAKTPTTHRTSGGKVFNDDGTWHYGGSGQPATMTTKK